MLPYLHLQHQLQLGQQFRRQACLLHRYQWYCISTDCILELVFSDENSMLGASTKPNPSYDFTHAGLYNARMVVVDKNGCTPFHSRLPSILVRLQYSPLPIIMKMYRDRLSWTMVLSEQVTYGISAMEQPPMLKNQWLSLNATANTPLSWSAGTDRIAVHSRLLIQGLYVPNAFAPEDTLQTFRTKHSQILHWSSRSLGQPLVVIR